MAIIKFKRGTTYPVCEHGEPAFITTNNQFIVGNVSSGVWVGAEINPVLGMSQYQLCTHSGIKTYVDNAIASGTASGSITINTTSSNSASVFYPLFSTSAGVGSLLYVDDTITSMSYVPSTSTLTVSNLSVSGVILAPNIVNTINGSSGVITGIAVTANPLSQFAATTSAQLAGVVSDETGSGVLVFATSPTLVTPNIGVATTTSLSFGSNTIKETSTGNDTFQIGLPVNIAGKSSALAIMDIAAFGDANRSPTLIHTNPNLYIYASGYSNANHYLRMENDRHAGSYIISGGPLHLFGGENSGESINLNSYGEVRIGDIDTLNNGQHISINDPAFEISLNASNTSVQGTLTVGGAIVSSAELISSTVLSGTGVSPTIQIICPSAALALTDGTVEQSVFAANAAIDIITVQASTTYMFDGCYILSTGTATHTTAMGFLLTQTSITNMTWTVLTTTMSAAAATSTTQSTTFFNSNSGGVLNGSTTNAICIVKFEGIMRVNAAGTITPQITFSSAPGGTNTVQIGSYIRFYPIGTNTISKVGTAIG